MKQILIVMENQKPRFNDNCFKEEYEKYEFKNLEKLKKDFENKDNFSKIYLDLKDSLEFFQTFLFLKEKTDSILLPYKKSCVEVLYG